MGRKSYALLSLLFVAGLLTQATAAQSGSEACSPVPNYGPWKAVNDVFRLEHDPAQAVCEGIAGQVAWSCVPDRVDLEFMIASVADPSQTHLSLNTDRALESLLWAVGDAGYSFENYWLPWSVAAEKEPSTISESCKSAFKERRESEPGLLIFRRNLLPGSTPEKSTVEKSTREKFLLVFVAGETPTSGINKSALSNAVKYIRAAKDHPAEIRLLGPEFSGSLLPLKDDLAALHRSVHEPGFVFHIVSGTVSSRDAIREFQNALASDSYESAVDNDVHASELFFNYLNSEWRPPPLSWFWSASFSPAWVSSPGEIAILSEDETVYGSGDIRKAVNSLAGPDDVPHDWLMLRYPREIARLRNAYSEGASGGRAKGETPTQNGAPLTLRDNAAGSEAEPRHADSISAFSSQQSPASQQAVLLSIVSALRRERAAYAGVVATDVLDSLFLTRFLRTSVPDIRVFTLDADLLFLRESETAPMTGLLAVTNYPLFSRNQHWTEWERKGQMPRRIQFNSRFAEGIYNACRRLIPPVELEDTKSNQPPERYLEFERPFDERRNGPPLWLTALGRDGYWPVALLDEGAPEQERNNLMTLSLFEPSPQPPTSRHENLHPEPPSRAWRLFFWLACTFCFLHSAYVLHLLRLGPASGPAPNAVVRGLGQLFAAYPERKPTDKERPFLLAATVSLFSSLLLFSAPTLQFLHFDWAVEYFVVACLCLLALLAVSVALARGKRVYLRVFILTWILAFAFGIIWPSLILNSRFHAGIFLAYRALYLGNGVSPGIPIVLLAVAFYGWAWVHLKQEGQSVGREQSRANNEFAYMPELQVLMWRTDETVDNITAHAISGPALVFLALWFLVLWPVSSLRSFESYWYDILYIFVLTVLYWCLALVWVQFIRCWRQFREFLQALERQPVRSAFSRLPREISWIPLVSASPFRNLFLSSRTCDSLQAVIVTAEKVCKAETAFIEPLKAFALQARTALASLEANYLNRQHADRVKYGEMQTAFDSAAACIAFHLQSGRWTKGASESLEKAEKELEGKSSPLSDDEKLAILEEEFIALRLLMFIRYVIRQLRNWMGFLMGGFIISVISQNSYPFQAHSWIVAASVIVLLGLGAGVVLVFAEMDRDAILSRITDSKANEVGKTFFFRLAHFGALPLLTVLAAQFPAIGRYVFTWLEPALDALK